MERLKNRWIYAIVAYLSSFAVLPIMALIIGLSQGEFKSISLDQAGSFLASPNHSLFIGFPVIFAALTCWPIKTNRTMARMIVAGCLTVALALFLMPICAGLVVWISNGKSLDPKIIQTAFMWLAIGSAFTLGIPYIIAAMVSLAFVGHSIVETD